MNKIKKENLFNWSVIVVFAIIILSGAVTHEMWFDEAEAWVIVRDNSISQIYSILKIEGHPFLWYLILKIFCEIGFPCEIMPVLSCLFTLATAILIVNRSPFNIVTKAAVLFSSGFLYFNSVISRVYCLIPLILTLIAIVFPERKKYSLTYGFLIAMLTNTHIVVCGIVAVLGINMIYDLFTDWNKINNKEKMKSILGLFIAGSGVAVLFAVMLGSLGANAEVASASHKSISGIINVLSEVGCNFICIKGIFELAGLLSGIFFTVSVCVFLFLLRHNKIPFLIMISFFLCYAVICGVIWYTIPNRAAIFVFVMFFCLWLSKLTESDKKTVNFSSINTESTFIRKILNAVENIDKKYKKNREIILTIIMLVSFPTGIVYLGFDYFDAFSPEKLAADYIRKNYDSGSTLVLTEFDNFPQLSCYIPEYSLYSLRTADYYTYHDHSISYKDAEKMCDVEKIGKDLKKWDTILLLSASSLNDESDVENIQKNIGDLVFVYISPLEYALKSNSVVVENSSYEKIMDYLDGLKNNT